MGPGAGKDGLKPGLVGGGEKHSDRGQGRQ